MLNDRKRGITHNEDWLVMTENGKIMTDNGDWYTMGMTAMWNISEKMGNDKHWVYN